jgi:hypothetical protein
VTAIIPDNKINKPLFIVFKFYVFIVKLSIQYYLNLNKTYEKIYENFYRSLRSVNSQFINKKSEKMN